MKQQCYLAVIYLNWAFLAASIVFFAIKGYWALVVAWLVALPLAVWAYIRIVPSVDHKRPSTVTSATTEVTIYTALGCPFCPIVKERLIELSRAMGFSLKEVDVTLKIGLLTAMGIHSLPVVECGTVRVEGNATSERLANLIAGAYAGKPALAR